MINKGMSPGYQPAHTLTRKDLVSMNIYHNHHIVPRHAGGTDDPTNIIKFRCKSEIETYFLVWTTTPWTLPSNLAICVHPDMEYGVYEKDNKV